MPVLEEVSKLGGHRIDFESLLQLSSQTCLISSARNVIASHNWNTPTSEVFWLQNSNQL